MSVILPVEQFCLGCGWAYEQDKSSICRRCGQETLSVPEIPENFLDTCEPIILDSAILDDTFGPPPLMSPSPKVYPREHGLSLPHAPSPRDSDESDQKDEAVTAVVSKLQRACKPFKRFKSMSKANRRSRAYSKQFIESVNFAAGSSEQIVNARPLINNIVSLAEQCYESKDSSVLEEMEHILTLEKQKGSSWQEIADEAIMELIINELKIIYFAKPLMKAYGITTHEFGHFISTPLDRGTMSLMEEAVCHDSMSLFVEILQIGDVLSGVLESKDVPAEAQEKIIALLS